MGEKRLCQRAGEAFRAAERHRPVSGGACPAQLPICCVTPGKPPSLSGLQRNKRTRVFFPRLNSHCGAEETHILEGHLSSLQLPRLALNSFLSPQQEHRGQASSAPAGLPPRKTEAPGAARQNQAGGWGAPAPTKGERGSPNQSSGGVPVLSQPRNNTAQVLPQILPPRGGWQRSPQVPAFFPLSMEFSLWRNCSRIPRKFPRNTCRTLNHNKSILSAIGQRRETLPGQRLPRVLLATCSGLTCQVAKVSLPVLVAQSCLTLCDPQGPLSTGFSRQEYWSGLPYPSPGDLPDSRIKSGSPAWHADSLPMSHHGSPSQ